MNYFVVGDIHGCYSLLNDILTHWNPDNEQLVFTGDLIDRGTDSLSVVTQALLLQQSYGAKIIMGNHEELFINWLIDPVNEHDIYFPNGGDKTVQSFLDDRSIYLYEPKKLADMILTGFPKEIDFLTNLIPYYETEKYIFVHAGMDLNLLNWRNQEEHIFRWIRHPFIYGKNETGKTIIFGHTITRNINIDKSDEVWFSPCGTKIGIDGAAVFGGKLHALKIHNEDIRVFSSVV